jgi:hypothetical protein
VARPWRPGRGQPVLVPDDEAPAAAEEPGG